MVLLWCKYQTESSCLCCRNAQMGMARVACQISFSPVWQMCHKQKPSSQLPQASDTNFLCTAETVQMEIPVKKCGQGEIFFLCLWISFLASLSAGSHWKPPVHGETSYVIKFRHLLLVPTCNLCTKKASISAMGLVSSVYFTHKKPFLGASRICRGKDSHFADSLGQPAAYAKRTYPVFKHFAGTPVSWTTSNTQYHRNQANLDHEGWEDWAHLFLSLSSVQFSVSGPSERYLLNWTETEKQVEASLVQPGILRKDNASQVLEILKLIVPDWSHMFFPALLWTSLLSSSFMRAFKTCVRLRVSHWALRLRADSVHQY